MALAAAGRPAWRSPSAQSVVSEAVEAGVGLDVAAVRGAATAAVGRLVTRAVASRQEADVDAAVTLLELLQRSGVVVDLSAAQEAVYGAVTAGGDGRLDGLGLALGLAIGRLGVPT